MNAIIIEDLLMYTVIPKLSMDFSSTITVLGCILYISFQKFLLINLHIFHANLCKIII